MSTSTKLHGGKASELTRFKELWLRESFAESRDYWLEQFVSARPQAELRAEIFKKLKINLRQDNQLTAFRQWVDSQQQRELMAEKIEERKAELLAGGMTLEQAQDVLLTEASAYSVAARDFKLGVKVSSEITKSKSAILDRQKFEWDAAQECLKRLPELKAVSDAPKLSADEKAKAIQQILFPK